MLLAAGAATAALAFRTMRRARRAGAEATVAVRDPYLARGAAAVGRLAPGPD